MNRFDGRTAIVTGGGSGIGQATVLRLLDEGATVLAADISTDGLTDTQARADNAGTAPRLSTTVLDIADETAVQDVVGRAITDLGRLDVLVNAAGILRGAHTHDCSLELWNHIIAVNLTGTFLVTRTALPALLDTGRGVIVNFSSTSASFSHPFMAAYSASKGGIEAFTHAIAGEYAKQGLRAVNIAPGSISSGITNNFTRLVPSDIDYTLLRKLTPALGQNHAAPETVAGVVAMLASDDGAFITGTEIRIDGGTHQ
ncbi:SDR family NAD(P)-dependent oxidoreductase [Micromonospora sp. NPDC047620]|uniref:SDR family NAD(P)-dependent oxidoreductase n=1 Tax=Micromonospora sp. NPDC047620 TaxID=3364251 RepID=UPI0037214A5F